MFIIELAKGVMRIVSALAPAESKLGDLIVRFSEFIINLRDSIKEGKTFEKFINNIVNAIFAFSNRLKMFGMNISEFIKNFIKMKSEDGFFKALVESGKSFIDSFKNMDFDILKGLESRLAMRAAPIIEKLKGIFSVFEKIKEKIAPVKAMFKSIGKVIGEFFKNIIDSITEWANNIDPKDINFDSLFDKINSGLLAGLLFMTTRFVNKGSNIFDNILGIFKSGKGLFENANTLMGNLSEVLTSVKNSMETWQKSIRADIIWKIAGELAVLAISLIALSMVDSKKLSIALGAITVLFVDLFGAMATYEKVSGASGGIAIAKGALGMLAMAGSILLLAGAVKTIASVDPKQMTAGILGITALMGSMVASSKIMTTSTAGVIKTALAMILFGLAVRTMVKPIREFGSMDQAALAQGILVLAGVLTGISGMTYIVKEQSITSLAFSLIVMSGALFIFTQP